MGGLRKKPWSFKDVHLKAKRASWSREKKSVKTHLVLQKYLSDQ